MAASRFHLANEVLYRSTIAPWLLKPCLGETNPTIEDKSRRATRLLEHVSHWISPSHLSVLQKSSTAPHPPTTVNSRISTSSMYNSRPPKPRFDARRQMKFRQHRAPNAIAIDTSEERFGSSSNHDPHHCIKMSEWLADWETAPADPLPSSINILSLLYEPAKISLHSHATKAKAVALVHYDANMVPKGRAIQDQRLEEEAIERFHKQDAGELAHELNLLEKRKEVVRAAKEAEVIDLTQDSKPLNRAPWNLPLGSSGRRHIDFYPASEYFHGLPRSGHYNRQAKFRVSKPSPIKDKTPAASRARVSKSGAKVIQYTLGGPVYNAPSPFNSITLPATFPRHVTRPGYPMACGWA